MSPLHALLLALICVSASQAQDGAGQGTTMGSRVLQPWLVGLTAVVVFLFIIMVLMIVNRVWCQKRHRNEEEPLESPDNTRHVMNAYDNKVLEDNEEVEVKKEAKITSL